MNEEEVQAILKDLANLKASGKNLDEPRKAQAKELFCRLKVDYTNLEIYELTKHQWSMTDIKRYTKSVKTIKRPPSAILPTESSLRLTADNITSEEVKEALALRTELDESDISVEDVSSFLSAATKAGVLPSILVSILSQLAKSEVPASDYARLYEANKSLQAQGITPFLVEKIAKTAKIYGDASSVIQAIEEYGSLEAIRKEKNKIDEEKKTVEDKLKVARTELQDVQNVASALGKSLTDYEQLAKSGYDGATFGSLVTISERFGGVAAVLEGIKKYGTLIQLNDQVSRTKTDLDLKTAQYMHFSQITDMCDKLIGLKFSVTDIERLYNAAQQFGAPIEVLDSIMEYGKLVKLKEENGKLAAQHKGLTNAISILETRHLTLTSSLKTLDDYVPSTLNIMKANLEDASKANIETFTKMTNEEGKRLKEFLDQCIAAYAKTAVLKEELDMARIIQAIRVHPEAARGAPHEYAPFLLDIVIQLLKARGIREITVMDHPLPVVDSLERFKKIIEGLSTS